MPTKTSERWIKDGDYMKEQLEAAGYKVNLQYANDDIPTQVTQLENMITKRVDILVVASIDGTALGDVLATAKSHGIPVIAYDRLMRDTDAVEYYTTFDNLKVGMLQAESLLKGLEGQRAKARGTSSSSPGPPTTTTRPSSSTVRWRCSSRMIDDGNIMMPSGETDFKKVAILRWDPATAQKRMEDILTKTYASDKVNGVLSPYDGLSRGIIAALKGYGYSSGGKTCRSSPARTPSCSRSSRSSLTSSTPRSSRTRRSWPRSPWR